MTLSDFPGSTYFKIPQNVIQVRKAAQFNAKKRKCQLVGKQANNIKVRQGGDRFVYIILEVQHEHHEFSVFGDFGMLFKFLAYWKCRYCTYVFYLTLFLHAIEKVNVASKVINLLSNLAEP